MRTFSQKQTQPQKLVSSSLTRSNGPAHETAHSQHHPARFDFARIRIQPAGRSLPFLDTIQRSFGRHNISDIQAHTDSRAAAEAQSMGALAFARGREVKFAHPASLRTAAHEAAHVVQQRAGVAIDRADAYERHADQVADRVSRGQSSEALLDVPPGAGASHPQSGAASAPVIQMRRIPPNVRALLTAAGGADGANFTSNAEGAQRLIDRAMADLDPAQRVWVLMQRRGALTEAQFLALPQREQLSRHAEAIVGLFPSRKMGDPKLIDTGPRPAAPDAANLMKLVTRTNKVFDDIASGARDEWLTQVFGARSIRAAKAKYAKARKAMNDLHKKGSIVTDRSGYSEEVALAGLTDPPGTVDQKIRLEKSDIDKPDDNDSVATLLHESMHAGNADIGDMYTGIQTETEAKKLTFATCYEVIVWRILEPANQQGFPANPPTVPPTFQTFVPPGTKVGSKKAPDLTKAEIGAKAAIDLFRSAWNTGLNLQGLYFDLFRKPTSWTAPQPASGGGRFDKALPFWSKVEKLTIHTKAVIDPVSPDEAKHPVSQIDLALSEGLVRKLAAGMGVLDPLEKEAGIIAFEDAHSTPAERAGPFPRGTHTSYQAERDFLLMLATRHTKVAPMTGNLARDLRVVHELGQLNWGEVLKARNPSSFPD